jgi:hypothetical protein
VQSPRLLSCTPGEAASDGREFESSNHLSSPQRGLTGSTIGEISQSIIEPAKPEQQIRVLIKAIEMVELLAYRRGPKTGRQE